MLRSDRPSSGMGELTLWQGLFTLLLWIIVLSLWFGVQLAWGWHTGSKTRTLSIQDEYAVRQAVSKFLRQEDPRKEAERMTQPRDGFGQFLKAHVGRGGHTRSVQEWTLEETERLGEVIEMSNTRLGLKRRNEHPDRLCFKNTSKGMVCYDMDAPLNNGLTYLFDMKTGRGEYLLKGEEKY